MGLRIKNFNTMGGGGGSRGWWDGQTKNQYIGGIA